MWLGLYLCLLLAHLMADFVLQSNNACQNKVEKKWHSTYHYEHAAVVFALSWFAVWNVSFWWYALVIGITHFAIDMWKSYREEKVTWFVVDQLLHIIVIAGITWLWISMNEWCMPFGIQPKQIALACAIIICWKPANILIKLTLKHYSVNMPDKPERDFNAGALIGNLERWLILVFVIMQRYDAIGLLIAAKSIIRFGDSQTRKSEYVLAGTLMSIFIAVVTGLMVIWVINNS